MLELQAAKNAPLDGSAIVEFSSLPGVQWRIVGRFPEVVGHPERVRVIVENDERGESYFTEAHLSKVTPVFDVVPGQIVTPEPVVVPVEAPAEAPQAAPSVIETGDTTPVGTVSDGPDTEPVVPVPGEPPIEIGIDPAPVVIPAPEVDPDLPAAIAAAEAAPKGKKAK